jgi:hypothetical protein
MMMMIVTVFFCFAMPWVSEHYMNRIKGKLLYDEVCAMVGFLCIYTLLPAFLLA